MFSPFHFCPLGHQGDLSWDICSYQHPFDLLDLCRWTVMIPYLLILMQGGLCLFNTGRQDGLHVPFDYFGPGQREEGKVYIYCSFTLPW